jgi:Rieske Fe-S protein
MSPIRLDLILGSLQRRLERRLFLALALGAAWTLAGCEKRRAAVSGAVLPVGALGELKPGINEFPKIRVFVIRRTGTLQALSAVCSHQSCLVARAADSAGGFLCPCHGSRFSEEGQVQLPPAQKPLTAYRVSIGADGAVLVHLGEEVPIDWRFRI